MNIEPREWHPQHHLIRVELVLTFPRSSTPGTTTASARGYAETRRGPLWHEANVWTEDDEDAHYGPTDWVHHVALAAYQDRPSNPVELLQALTGGLGFQEKLPF